MPKRPALPLCKKYSYHCSPPCVRSCQVVRQSLTAAPKPFRYLRNRRGAKLSIYDSKQKLIATQTTPTLITLRREQGYFSAANYRMVCEMPGYTSSEMQFKSTLNPWYLGNIVFGGLIGILIVDPATGAMWSFPSKELNFTLGSLGTSPEAIKASEGYAERLKNSLPVKSEQEATAKQ